jgi:hypothetical protein
MQETDHKHGAGLAADIDRLLRSAADRRTSLRWLLAGAAALPIGGCGGTSGGTAVAATLGDGGGTATGCSPAQPRCPSADAAAAVARPAAARQWRPRLVTEAAPPRAALDAR